MPTYLPTTGGTLSGTLYQNRVQITPVGGNVTIDLSLGNYFYCEFSAAGNISFTNWPAGVLMSAIVHFYHTGTALTDVLTWPVECRSSHGNDIPPPGSKYITGEIDSLRDRRHSVYAFNSRDGGTTVNVEPIIVGRTHGDYPYNIE